MVNQMPRGPRDVGNPAGRQPSSGAARHLLPKGEGDGRLLHDSQAVTGFALEDHGQRARSGGGRCPSRRRGDAALAAHSRNKSSHWPYIRPSVNFSGKREAAPGGYPRSQYAPASRKAHSAPHRGGAARKGRRRQSAALSSPRMARIGTAAGRDLRNFHLMQAFLAARDEARETLVTVILKLTVLAAALMYGLPLLLQHHH